MRVEAKHSHGQVALEITAENANDRALFGLFDDHNNKNGFPHRRIACTSTYSCDVSAVTQLYLYGMDMKPPAPIERRGPMTVLRAPQAQPPVPAQELNPPAHYNNDTVWNAAIEAAAKAVSGAPLFPTSQDYSPRDDAKMLSAMDILDKHIRKLKR